MMFKKSLDIVSLVAIAVFGSIAIWLAIWGESPREPGHMSIQSKILLWDIAPFVFAPTWLIVRYANAAAARFPFPLSPERELKAREFARWFADQKTMLKAQ